MRALALATIAGAGLLAAGSSFGAQAKTWQCNYADHSSNARKVLFDNGNAFAVGNGGKAPLFSTKGKPYCLGYVQTYHWNGGAGTAPGPHGTIAIQQTLSTAPAGMPVKKKYTFQALGSPGQNGVQNANWYAYTDKTPAFVDGTYRCLDSNVTTWSSNKQSHGFGFCRVEVYPAVFK